MRLPTRNQERPIAKCPYRHDHHWMVRQYQGCSKSIMTIPWTMWLTHCRGWTYPTWRSNHCFPRREEGLETNPSRILRHIKVPVQGKTMHILAWHQQRHQSTSRSMHHLSETLTSGAKTPTEANTTPWVTLATTLSWLHDIWWKWILSFCWLVLKDVNSMEDSYIIM